MKYIKGLDTIRALALIIIIICHWGFPIVLSPKIYTVWNNIIQYGRFGLINFFVLSGFLITTILLNEKEKYQDKPKFESLKKFFARRFLRIFPIYYLFIFGMYLTNEPYIRAHIWYYVGYSSNVLRETDKILPHFWSLSVEEQFYLVWPWIILFVNKKYFKFIFLVSVIIGLVSQYISYYSLNLEFGHYSLNCFDSFGVGAFYAYLRMDKEKCLKFEQTFKAVLPFILFFAWKFNTLGGYPVIVMFYKFLDNILALAIIMFAINNKVEWIRKYFLENKTLNFLGKISYGLYIYHFTISFVYLTFIQYLGARFPFIQAIMAYNWIFWFSKLGMLIFISWLSYRFIEAPILRLKNKFEYT